MNVNTLVAVEPDAAQKAFEEYRAAFRESHDQTDAEIMRAYKALADGKTIISLAEAIRTAGLDGLGRPNLAIARADERTIAMQMQSDGSVMYTPNWSVRATDRQFSLPAGTLVPLREADAAYRERWWGTWHARLPFIPPAYRPPLRLTNYHLLWEAEWRQGAGPQTRDPMLLRRVSGDMFAVVAAWDLTDVEKLVLAR